MSNSGLRRPGRNALIALAMFVGGGAAILFGALEMNALGHETVGSTAMIGIGILVAIIGFFMTLNFVWGMRVMNAMRRGDTEIARWTVTVETFDRFRENDRQHAAAGRANDYRPPRRTPADGVEVIFAADGVIVGDTFFGLASTGLARFRDVRMLAENPLALEFGTAMLAGRNVTVPRLVDIHGTLRIPVAPTANEAAKKVLAHYSDVIARKTIVKPDFWRRRIRLGLVAAGVAALIAAGGFALNEMGVELGDVPLIMAVSGTIFAIGGLVLAFIAWALHMKQHHG